MLSNLRFSKTIENSKNLLESKIFEIFKKVAEFNNFEKFEKLRKLEFLKISAKLISFEKI